MKTDMVTADFYYNILLMVIYMAIGYLLCFFKKGNVAHGKTLSAILVYVLAPVMIINSFIQVEYTHENWLSILKYFGVSLFVQIVFFLVLFLILRKKYDDPKYRILSVASTLGNVGFFGMPLVTALFPNDPIVAVYSSANVLSMNLLVFTIGVFAITNDKKYISIKSALLNPTTLSVCIALPLFFFKVDFPAAIDSGLSLLSKMVTPICMIVLGMRLSTVKPAALFTRPFVYVTCALKLIVFPLFVFLLIKWLPWFDETFKITLFVLAAAPSGVVINSLAELHECEQELSANVVLLATLLSMGTIPLLLLLI